MEYLVTMTTHVPDGTPAQAVDEIRTREAARSRELAAQGHLLRLWRPPLQPGEWRTLGLFAAEDDGQLEEVLASMPLRVWRRDEVTPLSPHPNDPKNPALAAAKGVDGSTEFLTTFTISVPPGTPRQAVEDTDAREAAARPGTGRTGTPAAAVGLPGRVAHAGPVAGHGRGRDAGDLEVAAPGRLDDRADHAADRTPERPGADYPMTEKADMTQKVAIITGGSQGIGAGLVAGYRGQGWAVVATARVITPSEDPEVLTVDGDISEPATAERIIGAALERFGRIDTLVNNAGVYVSKPFTDYTAEDYATVTGVNLTGFFWLTQRAIAEMATRYGGHVVNISATLAEVASSGTPAVLTALTKGGLAAATRSLAVEYASRGIRVNAVSPGIIQTPVHPAGKLRRPRRPAPPARPRRPGQRRRRRHLVPGVIALHHRRDPAHRRRPDRRPLTGAWSGRSGRCQVSAGNRSQRRAPNAR